MKRLRLLPLKHPISATLTVPGSKSYTNRALLLAALTPQPVKIISPLISDDTRAMVSCLSRLGIEVTSGSDFIEVRGSILDVQEASYELDADLSGTTLRFLTALCCIIPGTQRLFGKAELNVRPIGELVNGLKQLGAKIEYLDREGYPPLLISSSTLSSGTVKLSGSESSQYLSALLMIAPIVGDVTITVPGKLISQPYVNMTIAAMKDFKVAVTKKSSKSYHIKQQPYMCREYRVEGDVSSASYFFAIAALNASTLTLKNLNPKSIQADMGFLKVLEKMGNTINYGKSEVTIIGKGIRPVDVNMQDCPDQAQTLAVLAAFAKGVTTISGIESLRVKETERIKALEQELEKMGIQTSSTVSSLKIHGGNPKPASIATHGDHRMAMAFAVAGTKLAGVEICDPDVVTKTFPVFWEKLTSIGVGVEYIERNIVLVGMRGSGKTTVSKQLAEKLAIEHLDLDTLMSQKLGASTADIVAEHGWDYFRDQEAAITKEVSALNQKLISTGGGVVLRPENVASLQKNGTVVMLHASPEVLVARLGDSSDRPALTDAETLEEEVEQVLAERQKLYEDAADVIIDTDSLSPEQVVAEILSLLDQGQL